MQIYDLKELLERAYSDEFTAECIGKATNISAQLINRYYNGEHIEKNEICELGKVSEFLMELYRDDIMHDEYIAEIVQTLEYFYGITEKMFANYLNITINEFQGFLKSPCKSEVYLRYSLKILHLFMSFVRERE